MDKRVRRFTEDEVSLLTAFADQASLALEKARLLNEAEKERERSDALYQVSNRLAGVHDTDEVLDLIVNEAARLVGAFGAVIRLLEGDNLVPGPATESTAAFLAESSTYAPTYKVGDSANFASRVMATKKPSISEDWAKDETIPLGFCQLGEKHGFHGTAVVPLLANDKSIGVLIIVDLRIRRFTDDEVSLLTAFADQASLALEKARLLNEAETRERQATQLYEVTTQLASNHDLASVLDLIVQKASELLDSEASSLFSYDGGKGGLVLTREHNFLTDDDIAENYFFQPGVGTVGRASRNRKPAWINNLRQNAERNIRTPRSGRWS